MVGLLFNPQGRIGAGEFWQGVIIILIVSALLGTIRVYGPMSLALPLGLLSLLLIYPEVCVFAKRFHDAGKSGWWFLAVIGIYIVITAVIGTGLTVALRGDLFQPGQTPPQLGSPEFAAMQREMTQKLFLPATALSFVAWLVISYFVARLKPDPEENKFGMPAGAGGPVSG